MKWQKMMAYSLMVLSVATFLTILLGYSTVAQVQRQEVDVAAAARQGLAEVNVQASGRSYYGPGTLIMKTTNRTDRPLAITVPQGLRFRSMDTRYQDEIVAVPVRVDLAPGETKTTDLTSFCGNAGRAAPVAGAQYAIGDLEGEPMRRLLATIQQRGLQNSAEGQWAVWTLTDGLPTTPNRSSVPGSFGTDSAVWQALSGGPISPATVQGVISAASGGFPWWILIPPLILAVLLWWWLRQRQQRGAVGRPGFRSDSGSTVRPVERPEPLDRGADITHGRPHRPSGDPTTSAPKPKAR